MARTASTENPRPTKPPGKNRGINRKEHPMKKMNRREFLTLTGAAVVALSLAGCGRRVLPHPQCHRQGSQGAGGHQQVSWSTARAYAG